MTCQTNFDLLMKMKRARTRKMRAKWRRELKKHILVCENCKSVKI